MAALLQIAPPHGATDAADTIARLHRTVQATLDRQTRKRPPLVCHWLQDADGRLSCHWEIELSNIPVPPD